VRVGTNKSIASPPFVPDPRGHTGELWTHPSDVPSLYVPEEHVSCTRARGAK
jgi:hypothetical protein